MAIETDKLSEAALTAEKYLEKYSVFRKMIEMGVYGVNYFGKAENLIDTHGRDASLCGSRAAAEAAMFAIRRFVLSLGASNEKVFLFYHYIHGETTERCAELMNISRRQAFRLKKRALELAGRRLGKYEEKKKEGVR